MKLSTLLVSALLLSACHSTGSAPAPADNPMAAKPGPEHAILHKMAGTWEAEVHMEGSAPEKGVCVHSVTLDGLWLQTEFKSTMMGSTFVGHDLNGYDTFKQKYVGCWIDSWSPYMVVSEGTYDPATKSLTMSGDSIDPASGGPIRMVNVTKFIDDDHMVFSMHPGGADAPAAMTIHYTRK